MKRFLLVLMAALMVFSLAACQPTAVDQDTEDAATPAPTAAPTPEATAAAEETAPAADYKNEIVYGSTTESRGDFIHGWTNSAIDNDAKTLMSGYALVEFTKEKTFEVNQIAVKEYTEEENADGSKTYTFTINEGLTYNNGDPITAVDYLASVMLSASPNYKEIENITVVGSDYVGYQDYYDGKTTTFSGLRLLGDYQLSITVAAEQLPYHYDLSLVAVDPTPVHLYAPSATITDDGSGATIEGLDTEELKVTILDTVKGFRYAPMVTAGPYQFESFNVQDRTIVLARNPLFKGGYDGAVPKIERIIMKLVIDATMMDELAAGSVDLLAGLNGGERITAGLTLSEREDIDYIDYPRYGYGKIQFACDIGPTQFAEVRQAIAYCLDRPTFVQQFTGGFGVLVNGAYSLSMREYQDNKEAFDTELNAYTFNIDSAKEVLIAGGWTLNADGKDFVEGTDTLRHKKVDGKLMPLTLQWAATDNNPVAVLIRTMLLPEAEKVGMKIEETTMEFSNLLTNMYRDGGIDGKYHMFNLATGFNNTNSPWYYYSSDPKYLGVYNNNFIADKELSELSWALKGIPSDDIAGWDAAFIEYQKRWNALLPDLPLYSDQYHDFFYSKLENYDADPMWSVRYAIVRANIAGHNEVPAQ